MVSSKLIKPLSHHTQATKVEISLFQSQFWNKWKMEQKRILLQIFIITFTGNELWCLQN